MKRNSRFAFGARHNPGEMLVLANPSKRKGKHKSHHKRKSHFSFRARRNPLALLSGAIPTLKTSAVGALGGLANDTLFGAVRAKLPQALQGDAAVGGLKLLSALALGFVANKVKPGSGRGLAIGAATCALHDAARNMILAKIPDWKLGEYVSMGSIGEYVFLPNSVGDYPSTAIPVSGIPGSADMGMYVGDTSGSGYDN